MKILLVHTFYNQNGGEDAVFQNEKSLLAEGNMVESLTFNNQTGLKGFLQFVLYPWNFIAARRLKTKIQIFKPDLIHIHNLHFASGPILVRTAHKLNIPIIATLHNYRLICPSATLLYKNDLYLRSTSSNFPWDAVEKAVYRNSKIQTFWLAFTIWIHKKLGTWKMIDKFLVLTEFAKTLFINSTLGISKNNFIIKQNFAKDEFTIEVPRNDNFLFIGRLSIEKGIQLLLDAFENSKAILKIAGDGPLKEMIVESSKKHPNIKYLGKIDNEIVKTEMAKCSALIFPSIWFEGMPMTIIEAFSTKTAVIANDLGAMSSMIINEQNGLTFFS